MWWINEWIFVSYFLVVFPRPVHLIDSAKTLERHPHAAEVILHNAERVDVTICLL